VFRNVLRVGVEEQRATSNPVIDFGLAAEWKEALDALSNDATAVELGVRISRLCRTPSPSPFPYRGSVLLLAGYTAAARGTPFKRAVLTDVPVAPAPMTPRLKNAPDAPVTAFSMGPIA
jgi:hypothetical protein